MKECAEAKEVVKETGLFIEDFKSPYLIELISSGGIYGANASDGVF